MRDAKDVHLLFVEVNVDKYQPCELIENNRVVLWSLISKKCEGEPPWTFTSVFYYFLGTHLGKIIN